MATISRGKIAAIAFMVSLAVWSAFADEAMVKGINWRYSLLGKTACIEGIGDMPVAEGRVVALCNKDIAIPGKIGKYTVTGIGDDFLAVMEGPKSIKVPASVTSIGKGAFCGNKNLAAVALPPKLTSIPEALFHTCGNLKSIKIPASVKSIGVEAFAECQSLKSIAIPQGVADIDRQAFRDCSNLASVSIPASVTNVGESVFMGCGKLAKIDVAKGSRAYKSVAGALYTKDGTTLVAWPAGSQDPAVTIPDGVTSIISWAFASPAITAITLPTSVTNISDAAFALCSKLTVIYAQPGDLDRLKAIIAEHNPKHGQEVEGRTYRGWVGYRDQMDKIKVEEKNGK